MMKNTCLLLLCFWLHCSAGISQDRIKVNIPTAEAEADYIWRTIQDTKFFEENNYQVALPPGMLVEGLKKKAKENQLTDEDYVELKSFVRDSVYDTSQYAAGFAKIEAQLPLLNRLLVRLSNMERDWDFKEFPLYEVNLTLYGPGGSYDPDEGTILIYTTPQGQYKQYDNPANTIIHEIVHIGVEASIVQKYQVPHRLKERIIDTFVSLCFGEDLPDYRIQNMGDERIDPYLKKQGDLQQLGKFVAEILKVD